MRILPLPDANEFPSVNPAISGVVRYEQRRGTSRGLPPLIIVVHGVFFAFFRIVSISLSLNE